MPADQERYRKQVLFSGLGREGQERLSRSGVLVAGVGALGGTLAMLMARAGVGRVRLVDKDKPELSNLHRQLLYDEADLADGRGKAELAGEHLGRASSVVSIEAINADITPDTVLKLVEGMDLILDGLDNPPTRYVLNDAAVKTGIPWIYTGVVAARGNVHLVIPGQTPCLRCLFPEPPPADLPGVDQLGIIGPTPAFAAALAAAQAIKHLAGRQDKRQQGIFTFDLWDNRYALMPIPERPMPDCPCCAKGRFEFLG
jgi:adenylyltransferase/sulfurtransferase